MRVSQLSSRAVRSINDRGFLDLLVDQGPLTRSQIAEAAGLSRPYVIEVVERLEARGLVTQRGVDPAVRRGPKAALIGLPTDLGLAIAVDVAFEEIRVRRSVLGERGHTDTVTPLVQGPDLGRQILDAISLGPDDREFRHVSVVIGLPGAVDPITGDIIFAWDRPDWHAGIADAVRGAVGHPVAFENEVNLRAIAEHDTGVAHDTENYLLLSLGQGVGSAIMLNGRVLRGDHGAAGEIGYLPLTGAGARPLRRTGTSPLGFQDMAGAVPLAAAIGAEHDQDYRWTDRLLALPPDADEWRIIAHAIGTGLLSMIAVVDLGHIVLAGELSRALGGALIQPLRSMVADHLPWELDLRVSRLGDEAVLVGGICQATALLRDHAFGVPPSHSATRQRRA